MLVRSHLLGDAFAHFGPGIAAERRVGWVYRWLGMLACRVEFFDRAVELDLLLGTAEASTRSWGHTVAEYAIDHLQLTRDGYLEASDVDHVGDLLSRLAQLSDLRTYAYSCADGLALGLEKGPRQFQRYVGICKPHAPEGLDGS